LAETQPFKPLRDSHVELWLSESSAPRFFARKIQRSPTQTSPIF